MTDPSPAAQQLALATFDLFRLTKSIHETLATSEAVRIMFAHAQDPATRQVFRTETSIVLWKDAAEILAETMKKYASRHMTVVLEPVEGHADLLRLTTRGVGDIPPEILHQQPQKGA